MFGAVVTDTRPARTLAIAVVSLLVGCSGLSGRMDADISGHPQIGDAYRTAFESGVRIPKEFRGEWSSDPKTCGIEGDDLDTRLIVGTVTVSFYDETHVVIALKAKGSRLIRLTYSPSIKDYHYMEPPASLSLSADGKALQGRGPDGESQGRWEKCAASNA